MVRNDKNVRGNRSESDLAFLGSTVSAALDIPPSMPTRWSATKARSHRNGDHFTYDEAATYIVAMIHGSWQDQGHQRALRLDNN